MNNSKVHDDGYSLYNSANYLNAHNGKLLASSEGPGKGASFTLELPVKVKMDKA